MLGFVLSSAGGTANGAVEETAAMATETEIAEEYTEIKYTNAGYTESGGSEYDPMVDPAFIGRLLLLGGGILAVLFIFFMKQEQPMAGPDIEWILLFLSLYGISQPLNAPMLVYTVYLWVLFCVLQVCARGLWSWLKNGFPIAWSAAHRLGLMAVGASEKQSRYMVFQFVFSIFGMAGMALFMTQARIHILLGLSGMGCLFAAILSVLCFMWRAEDEDHLAEQIRRLHQGNQVLIRDGAFAEEEEKLIDLNRQRDAAIQKAVASERFKVDLIANVSHDLRTPLTAILGYGELLEEEKLSPKGEKQLEELNRKAGYMRDLVESLFELTKVSSGVEECRKDAIDLIRLLEQTIGLFDDQLSRKGLQIRRHYETDNLTVVTDGARMHQVSANLIGNAIKYTLPGTRIHLEVKENGQVYNIRMINIASYEMDFEPEEILQRFARGDKARTTKGSGLGLAIAQTYTESVGGTFKVEIDGEQFSAIVTLPKN